MRGEHEHLGGGQGLENLPGGLQPVEQGHRDVHQDHVGTQFGGQRHRLASVGRFADHFEVVVEVEHLAKTFAHDHVIFREQNSYWFHMNYSFLANAIRVASFPPPRTRDQLVELLP